MNISNNDEIDNQSVPVEFVEISSLMKLHIKNIRKEMLRIINKGLNKEEEDETGEKIREIMEYAVFLNKRHFRSFFIELLAEVFELDEKKSRFVCAIIELINSCALMQSAMPDFENDDYIGGKETCHKKFGKDKTTIAINALFSLIFQSISNNSKFTKDERCKMVSIISKCCGHEGISGGSMMKVLMKKKKNYEDEIIRMRRLKIKALYNAGVDCIFTLTQQKDDITNSIHSYIDHYCSLLDVYRQMSSASSNEDELFEKAKLLANQAKQQLSSLKSKARKLVKLPEYILYLSKNQKEEQRHHSPVVMNSDTDNPAMA